MYIPIPSLALIVALLKSWISCVAFFICFTNVRLLSTTIFLEKCKASCTKENSKQTERLVRFSTRIKSFALFALFDKKFEEDLSYMQLQHLESKTWYSTIDQLSIYLLFDTLLIDTFFDCFQFQPFLIFEPSKYIFSSRRLVLSYIFHLTPVFVLVNFNWT